MTDKSGGTRMWCPECGAITVMRVLNPRIYEESYWYEDFPHGAGTFHQHPNVHVFHRVRQCSDCSVETHYYEIDGILMDDFLNFKRKQDKLSLLLNTLPDIEKDLKDLIKKLKSLSGGSK